MVEIGTTGTLKHSKILNGVEKYKIEEMAYMVFKGHGKAEDSTNTLPKAQTTKFLTKPRSTNSQYAASTNSQYAASTNSSAAGHEYARLTEQEVQEEFKRLYTQLEMLKEHNMRHGNRHLAAKISAMQEAAKEYRENIPEEDSDHLVVPTLPSKTTDTPKPPDEANHKVCKREKACDSRCSKSERKEYPSKHREKSPQHTAEANQMRSGHARTHTIVINLDDKNRFTEEVTV